MGDKKKTDRAPEFEGDPWKNPYVLYILLTLVLSGGLVLIGWFAWTHGWIPNRQISS